MKKKKLLTNLVIDSSHHSAHGINTDRCDGGLLLRNLDIKKQSQENKYLQPFHSFKGKAIWMYVYNYCKPLDATPQQTWRWERSNMLGNQYFSLVTWFPDWLVCLEFDISSNIFRLLNSPIIVDTHKLKKKVKKGSQQFDSTT